MSEPNFRTPAETLITNNLAHPVLPQCAWMQQGYSTPRSVRSALIGNGQSPGFPGNSALPSRLGPFPLQLAAPASCSQTGSWPMPGFRPAKPMSRTAETISPTRAAKPTRNRSPEARGCAIALGTTLYVSIKMALLFRYQQRHFDADFDAYQTAQMMATPALALLAGTPQGDATVLQGNTRFQGFAAFFCATFCSTRFARCRDERGALAVEPVKPLLLAASPGDPPSLETSGAHILKPLLKRNGFGR